LGVRPITIALWFCAICGTIVACDRTSAVEKHATEAVLNDKWDDAIRYANDWLSIDPTAVVAHYILNVAYTAQNKRDLSIRERDLAFGSSQSRAVLNEWTEKLVDEHRRSPRALWLRKQENNTKPF
jgi:hypothetical protein